MGCIPGPFCLLYVVVNNHISFKFDTERALWELKLTNKHRLINMIINTWLLICIKQCL